MKRSLESRFLPVAMLILVTAAPAGAEGKEQVVFSGESEGSLGEVGFWIWCAVDEAENYDDCDGAMASTTSGPFGTSRARSPSPMRTYT